MPSMLTVDQRPTLEKEVPGMAREVRWGQTPWIIDFHPDPAPTPEILDFAVIGAGFTGLSAAAALRQINPEKTVAVFEAETVGARSSGHTGGLVLGESAAGDLPGLGDVLDGFANVIRELNVSCDLTLPGAWELDRTTRFETKGSPVRWTDSGTLRVAQEVRGGTVDPGKLVSGLCRTAAERGVLILEGAPVDQITFADPLILHVQGRQIQARRILIATNSESLQLSDLESRAEPKLTLALATEALSEAQFDALGVTAGKPFYTNDLPYLWGRLLQGNRIIFGSGLVSVDHWNDLASLDIGSGRPAELLDSLKRRVVGLHPALSNVRFSYEWAGPILIAEQWRPVFARHNRSPQAVVLGAYSGHGVALSVYLGKWAAEALSDKRDLPYWGRR
jgi:glycine/D-amino acid oxidase-like deaminating enzyme